MNLERLDAIARWLEAGAPHKDSVKGFWMGQYGHCGTTCCIAGAAVQFWGDKKTDIEDMISEGAKLLDLDLRQAEHLFIGQDYVKGLTVGSVEIFGANSPKPAHAARVIRHLMETGNVNWTGLQS